jgi:hypothetical protein
VPLPAYAALAAAGLSLADAARQARISPAYFRRLARHGAPYGTAIRLARVLGCSVESFQAQVSSTPLRTRAGAARQGRRGAAGRKGGPPRRAAEKC